MDTTLILLISSILLLFLIFPLLYFLRRRVELRLEDGILILDYPLTSRKIDLEQELESWQVQKTYYIRWGVFHAIIMKFKTGKRITVSSLMNQKNYDLLYDHLSSHFSNRRTEDLPS